MRNKNTQQPDEVILHEYYRHGNANCLGILLGRYTVLLLGVCLKYLKEEEPAKDAVQQVFEKAIKELQKRYKIDNFGGWLYRIAVNHCLSELRNNRRLHSDITASPVAADEAIPDELHWQQVEHAERLKHEMQFLKEDQRIALEMFYFENKTYNDIASITGWDIKSIKSYIQNGKRNLKIRLEGKIKKD